MFHLEGLLVEIYIFLLYVTYLHSPKHLLRCVCYVKETVMSAELIIGLRHCHAVAHQYLVVDQQIKCLGTKKYFACSIHLPYQKKKRKTLAPFKIFLVFSSFLIHELNNKLYDINIDPSNSELDASIKIFAVKFLFVM